MKSQPIGIFDSGVGGLTVFSEIRKRFPEEDLIYFGDTARVPYGPKSRDTIIDYSIQNTRFLCSFQVKLIIIACNTSSAFAIDLLQDMFSVPIIGVLRPGAEQAVKQTKMGKVGVIGTEGTINSQAYTKEILKISPSAQIHSLSCPLFVPLVEEGWQNHAVASMIADEYLAPLKKEGIDTLVLGCTHYPILKKIISEAIGEDITLIDSALAISEYLSDYLKTKDDKPQENMIKERAESALLENPRGKDIFYVSDNEEKFQKIASRILGQDITNLVKVKLAESWFI